MQDILGIVLLATLIEGLITYLFGEQSPYKRVWLRYVSLILGVITAIAYKVNIPGMVGLVALAPVVNYIVSGLIIGRGANYLNDIFALIQAKKSAI